MKSKRLVIVVDDEHVVEQMVEKELEVWGYKHASFSEPEEAVRFFKQHYEDIDLAILDIEIDEFHANDMASQMRKLSPGLPIVVMTRFEEVRRATGTMTKFLIKPVVKEELIRTVRALIGTAREGREE